MSRVAYALRAVLICLTTLSAASVQAADSYPAKSIRLVVGFPPGTATDTVARLIAEQLKNKNGWTIIVENKVGQAGSMAATDVARAAPDGYTLLLSANGPLSTNPNLYSVIRYDPAKDFTAISRVAVLPYVMVVRSESPYRSVGDVVQAAKAAPEKLDYASLGYGTTSHLIAASFAKETGTQYLHIPYKGSAETVVAVMSGAVDFLFDTTLATEPQIKAGKMRALAVSTSERVAVLANAPTLNEAGAPGFDMAAWLGIVGPAGMPPEIVKTLNTAVHEAVNSTALTERLGNLGAIVSLSTPDEFQRFLVSEVGKWGDAIKQAGVPRQ
ncbi:MAG TPA: tripartite tricarboxylate transporter substrate binding protein [Bordetella sp.]|nr:tripartite tricarboxylate transporter substrate binding protein [Bordetella sp.]